MEHKVVFRHAGPEDVGAIWEILQQAIARRKSQGSKQWQDGYPNPETVAMDIEKSNGYVVENDGRLLAYAAIIFDIEPAYEEIKGEWLTTGEYGVVHRVAVSDLAAGKGLATFMMKQAEGVCLKYGVKTLRVDTNFDNAAMLKVLEKLGYSYCGKVYFRGSERLAYEKELE